MQGVKVVAKGCVDKYGKKHHADAVVKQGLAGHHYLKVFRDFDLFQRCGPWR